MGMGQICAAACIRTLQMELHITSSRLKARQHACCKNFEILVSKVLMQVVAN